MTKGKITIENLFGGWVSTISGTNTSSTLTASVLGKNDEYGYSSAISFFRLEKFGHISPGEVFTAITDVGPKINDLPLNGVLPSTGEIFAVLKNGRLIRTNTSGTTVTNSYTPTHSSGAHVAHTLASTSNGDILNIFDVQSTPAEWILWSWEDGTDADISIIKPDGSGAVYDWFSTLSSGGAVLRKGVPHKMCQGVDGNVYITNGQYIASATIVAGQILSAMTGATVNMTALNIGAGYTASGICTYKNWNVIVAYKSTTGFSGVSRSECRVFFWNPTSSIGYDFAYDIPDNYANGIYYDGKNLRVYTNGRNNSSKVWLFNGSGFTQEFESQLLTTSTTPRQGSFETYQDSIHLAAGTGIYQQFAGGFHNRTMVTDGTNPATSVGMLKNFYQGQLFAGVGIAGGLYKIYYQASFDAGYPGAKLRTRLYELPYGSNINKVIVYFSQFGSGSSFEYKIFNDYTTTALEDTTITSVPTGSASLPKYSHSKAINSVKNINSFYMDLIFNHSTISNTPAIVRKIEVYFDTPDRA